MSTFSEWKSKWIDKDPKSFDHYYMEDLRELLTSINDDELKTLKDHEDYIKVLRTYRKAIDTDGFHGKNYKSTKTSHFSQGEDGLYTDELRFLYELIQNADDCSYSDPSNCSLKIGFNTAKGNIVLYYNETGFSPKNVFAITGTAEAEKNIAKGDMQIGEKGIGFKSVFGVAKEVLIQSNKFSFKLSGEDFSLPIPAYDGYTPVKGTRITLFMDSKQVMDCYNELYRRYGNPESVVLNNNPIMFLNHLTSLYAYIDFDHSLTFGTRKKLRSQNEKISVFDYCVSVKSSNGRQKVEQNINCWRFEKGVSYDRTAVYSRYGDDTQLTVPRNMTIAAVFPKANASKLSDGALYSFLPTQVRLNIPAYCHVPYKLDGSREYVDPHPRGDNQAISA